MITSHVHLLKCTNENIVEFAAEYYPLFPLFQAGVPLASTHIDNKTSNDASFLLGKWQ